MKTIVINIYGGPGTGKSVTAAMLYSVLATSSRYGVVEHVTEYAKQLVWRIKRNPEIIKKLKDQEHVSNEQTERVVSVCGQADFIITDSPIRMGLVYQLYNNKDKKEEQYNKIENMMITAEKEYEEVNIFLRRSTNEKFQKEGRIHSEEESLDLDKRIENHLVENHIPYVEIYNKSDIGSVIGEIEEHLIVARQKKIESVLVDQPQQTNKTIIR